MTTHEKQNNLFWGLDNWPSSFLSLHSMLTSHYSYWMLWYWGWYPVSFSAYCFSKPVCISNNHNFVLLENSKCYYAIWCFCCQNCFEIFFLQIARFFVTKQMFCFLFCNICFVIPFYICFSFCFVCLPTHIISLL